jgi:5S rRNA maturation endonuclease (ribonuclease M5)
MDMVQSKYYRLLLMLCTTVCIYIDEDNKGVDIKFEIKRNLSDKDNWVNTDSITTNMKKKACFEHTHTYIYITKL